MALPAPRAVLRGLRLQQRVLPPEAGRQAWVLRTVAVRELPPAVKPRMAGKIATREALSSRKRGVSH